MASSISVLSNLKLAGALIFGNDETDFPANPAPGTLVVKGQNLYAFITIGGMQTWYPLIRSASATYIHTQGAPSLVWTVNHALNTNDLWFQVQDLSGNIVSPSSFESIDENSFRLHFSEEVVGTCVVIGTAGIDVPAIKASLIEVGANVRITTAGITVNNQPLLTSTTLYIGNGTSMQMSMSNTDRLDLVGGVGIEIAYDDVNNKVTFNAPGSSVTPAVVDAKIADVVDGAITALNTLGKLANSIGNDPAFAVTVTAAAATAKAASDAKFASTIGDAPVALNTLEKLADAVGNSPTFAADTNAALALKLDATEVTAVATANKALRLDATGKLPADITGNALTATNVTFAGVTGKPTTLAGYGITDGGPQGGSLVQNYAAQDLTVSGDILPTGAGQNIGSPTQRFQGIYVDEAHLSVNTLYLGDTAVMGTSADTINIKADPGQSINMKTTGLGSTLVSSERGVVVSTSGQSSDVLVQATGSGSQARLSATAAVVLTAPQINLQGDSAVSGSQVIAGGLTVNGPLTLNGAVTTVNSTTVTTADNIIQVNAGQVGFGVSSRYAGISVDRGDAADFQMVFDENDQMFKVGTSNALQIIASQNYVGSYAAPLVHAHAVATSAVSGFMSATDKSALDAANISIANMYSKTQVDAAIAAALVAFQSNLYSYE